MPGSLRALAEVQSYGANQPTLWFSRSLLWLAPQQVPSINEAHAINALVIRARLWQFRFITADGEVEKVLATKGFGGMDAGLSERMDRYWTLISSPGEQEAFDALDTKLAALRADWARLKGLPG